MLARHPLVGAFLLVGLLACNRGAEVSQERLSTARPVASSAAGVGLGALGHTDVGGQSRSLRNGALVDANMGRSISSRTTTPGETLKATVYIDALDDLGRVVIPTGAMIEMVVTELTPAGNRNGNDATMTLVITGVTIGDHHYEMEAELKSMYHSLEGRRFLAGEQNEALTNSSGVVAGRVLEGDPLGTIVGGAMRPAGSVVTAFQPAGRDIVVLAGTPIVIKLTDRFTLQWR